MIWKSITIFLTFLIPLFKMFPQDPYTSNNYRPRHHPYSSAASQYYAGSEQIPQSHVQHNTEVGNEEHMMLASIAQSAGSDSSVEAPIQGAIDDLLVDDWESMLGRPKEKRRFFNEEDARMYRNYPSLRYIDTTSFIVQRVDLKGGVTKYYGFEDSPEKRPLFMRSSGDFGVDFIVFMDPMFPKGTGHYVVLRRLEAQTDMMNYEGEEEVALHERNMDQMMDFDDLNEYEDEDGELSDAGRGNEYGDPRRSFPQMKGQDTEPRISDDEIPGLKQSGEENEQNVRKDEGDDGEGEGESNSKSFVDDVGLNSPYNETLLFGRGVGPQGLERMEQMKRFRRRFKSYDPQGNDTEIIYESFTIAFKDSIHGFINNIDPLQYSFQAEGDPAEVLTESQEEGDPNDRENTEGEDDDDDDSYGYALDEAPVDLFEDKSFYEFSDYEKMKRGNGGGSGGGSGGNDKRKKRSVLEKDDGSIKLEHCLRRAKYESWREREQHYGVDIDI